jgi:hypothetical protein
MSVSDATGSLGTRRRGALSPVRTFGHGRVCSAEGCTTVLSLYNPSDFCAVHERRLMRIADAPSRRLLGPLLVVRCAHDDCGTTFTTRNPRRKYCSDSCRMKAFQRRERVGRELRAA